MVSVVFSDSIVTLRLGPESLERGRVGHRAAVGGGHTQSGGLGGGGRHVRARFCSPGCRAVSAGRFRLSTMRGVGVEATAWFIPAPAYPCLAPASP